MLLISAFEPLLQIVEELSVDGAASKLSSGFESAVLAAFEAATKRAADAGYSDSDVEDVRFVYSVLIDEKILSAGVEVSQDWKKNLLQERYFDVITGGDHVFDRINRVIEPVPENYQRQLVYLHCLESGLVGASHRDLDSIEITKTRLGKSIGMLRASMEHQRYLCPGAYEGRGEAGSVNRTSRRSGVLFTNLLGVVTLTIIVVAFSLSIQWTLHSIDELQPGSAQGRNLDKHNEHGFGVGTDLTQWISGLMNRKDE